MLHHPLNFILPILIIVLWVAFIGIIRRDVGFKVTEV